MNKLNLIIASTLLMSTVAHAGPSLMMQKQTLNKTQILKTIKPVLKANLVAQNISMQAEICATACAEVKRELKIDKPCSPVTVSVRNTGNANASSFRVKLQYIDWKGQSKILYKTVMGGLARGQSKSVIFNSGANKVGYYRINSPFRATVDDNSRISESNEQDNIKTAYIR